MRSVLLAVLLATTPATLAAPAPLLPRKVQPLSLRGGWLLTWSGSHWHAVLAGDCSFEARRAGDPDDVWSGRWSQDGRTLTVTESNGTSSLAWTVTLDAQLSGVTDTGYSVTLERR